MTKRQALKLHNGDQVIRKSDRALLRVTAVRERKDAVWIEAFNEASGAYALCRHVSVS